MEDVDGSDRFDPGVGVRVVDAVTGVAGIVLLLVGVDGAAEKIEKARAGDESRGGDMADSRSSSERICRFVRHKAKLSFQQNKHCFFSSFT